MKFFGFLWIVSYISSFFSQTSLFKLSDRWSEGFLVRTVAIAQTSLSLSSHSDVARQFLQRVTQSVTPGQSSQISAQTASSLLPFRRIKMQKHFALTFGQGFQANSTVALAGVDLSRGLASAFLYDAATAASPRRSSTQVAQAQKMPSWSQNLRPYVRLATHPVVVTRSQRRQNPAAQLANLRQCQPVRPQRAAAFYQIWVRGHLIAELLTQTEADLIAQRIRQLLQSDDFKPDQLQPVIAVGQPAGVVENSLLFAVGQDLETALNRSSELIAIDWVNNLRIALKAAPLTLTEAQMQMYGLAETEKRLAGTASWYGPYFHGRLTAAGETFNQGDLTAAHPTLPFDTFLKVTNLESGKSVIVRVNDRGPYVGNRSLDLSREAARCLDSETAGVVPYKAVILKQSAQTAPTYRPIEVEQTIARRL
jgi:rare lipoprotein A (peptidoglycan hydrolase)